MNSPSVSTALPVRPSVARRRSRGPDVTESETVEASTCVYPQTPKPPFRANEDGLGVTVQVEDVDGQAQPTVLLVSNPLRNEKPLPPSPQPQPSPLQNVPLTPQVGPPPSSHVIVEQSEARLDQPTNGSNPTLVGMDVERFPTPDFSLLKRNPLHQALIAPLSFFRSRAPTPAQDVSTSSDSTSIKSSTSIKTVTTTNNLHRVASDASSVISGSVTSHESTTSSFGPLGVHNERFTNKFPIPPSFSRTSSLVSASRPSGMPGLIPPLAEIDDNDGGRWTKYKFVLFFSVVLVRLFFQGLQASFVLRLLAGICCWPGIVGLRDSGLV